MSDETDETYSLDLELQIRVPPGVARDRFFKLLATATDPRRSHETAQYLYDLVERTPGVSMVVEDVSVAHIVPYVKSQTQKEPSDG